MERGRWVARGLSRYEWLVLALCGPALLFPRVAPALTVVALGLLPCLWLARWLAHGRLTAPTPLDGPILGMLMALGVSLVVSAAPQLSLPKATGILWGVACYYALANHPQGWQTYRLLPWLGLGVSALALLGVDWVAFKLPLLAPIYGRLPQFIQGVPRTLGGGFHPNEVAGTLAMLIPLSVGGWIAAERRRGLWAASVAVMGAVLLLTQSRAGYGAALLALAAMLAVRYRWARWLGAAVLAALLVSLLVWGADGLVATALRALPGSHTWQARPEIWHNAWQTLNDYPLTGIGLNAFAVTSRDRYTYLVAPISWDFVHAHNIWLQTGVDLGWLGLIAFVAWMAISVALAVRLHRLPGAATGWALGVVGGLAGYLLFGLIDCITLGAKPTWLLWWMSGWLVSAARARGLLRDLDRSRWPGRLTVAAAMVMALAIGSLPAGRSVWWANLGHVAVNLGRFGQAAAWLERSVQLEPGNASARRGLGEAYMALGREAEGLLAWRAGGMDAKQVTDRGESHRRAGDLAAAERWHGWAITLDADLSDAWYNLGWVRLDQRRYLEAQQAFVKALSGENYALAGPYEEQVDAGDVRRALGISYARQGDWAAAAGAFEQGIALDAQDVASRYNLAQVQALQADHQAAHATLVAAMAALEGQARQISPVRYRSLQLDLAVALTTNANRRGDLAAAIQWAALAHRLDPRHAYPYADLAEVYITKGRYADALTEIEAYLMQGLGSPGMAYLAGRAYAGLEAWPQAVQSYEAALAQRPDVAAFHYRLAEALRARGDVEGAAQALERAQGLGEDGPLYLTGNYRLLPK